MRSQRLGVADVDQAREQPERVEEARAGGTRIGVAALEAEAQDARGPPAHLALRQGVVRVVGQPGIAHPLDLGMALQELRQRQAVLAGAVHAQRQGFDALQRQPGVERRNGRAHVAQRHNAGAANVGGGAQGLGVDHAVVAHVGFVQALEACLVFGPGELAAVDDDAADAVAVAVHVLGERVHDDVGAVLDGAAQVGAGYGVVDDQRHAGGVRHLGQGRDIGHVAQRVADGFAEHGLGARVDQRGKALGFGRVGKTHLDALLREGVGEQVVGAAVECAGRDDVVAGLGDGLDGRRDRRHAGGQRQRRHAAFERRHALLEHVGGRVHDARVDVARDLQVEQVGTVLGVVEGVGRGLVERDGGGFGRRVGRIAGMYGKGLDAHGAMS